MMLNNQLVSLLAQKIRESKHPEIVADFYGEKYIENDYKLYRRSVCK